MELQTNRTRFEQKSVPPSQQQNYSFICNTKSSKAKFTNRNLSCFFFLFVFLTIIRTLPNFTNGKFELIIIIWHSLNLVLAGLTYFGLQHISMPVKYKLISISVLNATVTSSLIITDDSIISSFSDVSFTENSISSIIFIILHNQIIRFFLPKKTIFVLFVYTQLFFAVVSFVFSQKNTQVIVLESLFIFVYFINILLHPLESKNISEGLSYIDNSISPSKDQLVNLSPGNIRAENLFTKCQDVLALIENYCKSTSYQNSSNLQRAFIQISQIKHSLARKDLQMIDHSQLDTFQKEYFTSNGLISRSIKPRFTRGTTVDQILLQNSQKISYNQLQNALSNIGKEWNFDIWLIHSSTGHSLVVTAKYILYNWSIKHQFSVQQQQINNYFESLQQNYPQNPYHNACHAADVMISFAFFLSHAHLAHTLTSLDVFACVIASLGHDVGHPGVNNRYLINTLDQLALRYNDLSVLENMHASKTFQLMHKPHRNILSNLQKDEWIHIRKLIVEMILATDMSRHFQLLGTFRVRAVTLKDLDLNRFDDKQTVLALGIKCADLGHSAKDINLHTKWSYFICEEFFEQGDLEKAHNMPVSMFCDREESNIANNQIGFLSNICIPLYEAWNSYLECEEIKEMCLDQLKSNLMYWENRGAKRNQTVSTNCPVSRTETKTRTIN